MIEPRRADVRLFDARSWEVTAYVMDTEGRFTSEDLVKRLRAQAEGFIAFVDSLTAQRPQ